MHLYAPIQHARQQDEQRPGQQGDQHPDLTQAGDSGPSSTGGHHYYQPREAIWINETFYQGVMIVLCYKLEINSNR